MVVRILGLDPGTANTGYVSLVCDTETRSIVMYDCGLLKTAKDVDGEVRDRVDLLGDELRKLVEKNSTTHIALEDFTEQGKLVGKTYKEMSWLVEHFRMVGRELGVETDVYENQFWKRTLMRAGRATKAQVEHYVAQCLPDAVKTLSRYPDHVWDAAAIALCKFRLLLTPQPALISYRGDIRGGASKRKT